jgi:hypothetical protein
MGVLFPAEFSGAIAEDFGLGCQLHMDLNAADHLITVKDTH